MKGTYRQHCTPCGLEFVVAAGSRPVCPTCGKYYGTEEERPDNVEGYLEVGTDGNGQVVINLDKDRNGVGHIIFSPRQARGLAESLIRQAALAHKQKDSKPYGEFACGKDYSDLDGFVVRSPEIRFLSTELAHKLIGRDFSGLLISAKEKSIVFVTVRFPAVVEDLPTLRAIVDQLEASVFKDSLDRLHAEAEGQ